MTTHLAAAPAGSWFALDPPAACRFLAKIRRIRYCLYEPGSGETWWSAEEDWDPRDLYDADLPHLEQLIGCAVQAGAVTCPDGWDLQMLTLTDEDGDQRYVWRLAYWDPDVPHLGFTLASESLEHLSIIGRADVRGAVAVLEVLREAVTCANRILAAYIAAAGRMRHPDARASEIPA